jgi:hypothetical protein
MAMLRRLLVLLLLPIAPALARADTVVLQGGTKVTGIVLRKDDRALRLLLPDGDEQEFLLADVAQVVPDASTDPSSPPMRWEPSDAGGGALQVQEITLVKDGAPRVDLIGAVHVADRSFYHDVQALLEREDVVLYEMVKRKADDPAAKEDEKQPNPIRDFQAKLGKFLGLTFQLDEISYDRPHFVHADITVDDLTSAMKGEPLVPPGVMFLLRIALPVLDKALEGDAGKSEGLRNAAKRMMGRVLGNQGKNAATLLGPAFAEVVIERRNAVVIDRLREIPAGTGSVGVFYGAAHLPDLEKRIVAELGYRRAGARWLDAWKVE